VGWVTGPPLLPSNRIPAEVSRPSLGAIAVPATATVGEPAGFAAAAGDALTGTTISWDFGDGARADGNVVSHAFGEPGAATVTVTATDEAGNTTSQSRAVAVQATPPAETVKPTVSRVKLTNTRFRVAKAAPAGTALRLRVSERSTLAIAIARSKIVRGTLVRAGVAPGTVSVPFSGRLGRTALPAGSYTATITAIDGAGNRSRAVIARFTIVKK
jgi:hypothetical protein